MSLADLIDRVERAEIGDRELDGLIEVAARAVEAARTGLAPEHWAKWESDAYGWVGDKHTVYEARPFTASVDSALGLVERMAPAWAVALRQDARPAFDGLWHAMTVSRANTHIQHATWGSTPALAIVSATLRALQDQTDGR